ncbi:MAG: 5'-methylthioadenosine/adenosylhomocysteine nucleosidase [Clostridia bacterium]|nr:5'-methylthioadenosine/adenosylhomocysteine nucleosidase [Clostridia bacterium]
MIGIIGAMDVEIENIIKNMTDTKSEEISSVTYTSGKLKGKDVVCAVCGIGKVFAAICTQTMILRYNPDIIINTGIAGSLSADLRVCDTVVAESLVQHDMDTTYFGDPKGFVQHLGIVNIPCNEELGIKICSVMENKGVHCVRGVIATGDAFIADEATKNDIAKTFNAIACDMEGASIALVSYMGNVKCVVMRTVSDGAEGNDEYETNKDETAKKSTEALISVVEAL